MKGDGTVGMTQRKDRQRRAVKDGILTAARGIAREGGWKSVTIRRIAERIEYSSPVIYEHFASKDEILLTLMRQGYAEQLHAVEVAIEIATGPEEAMLGVARAWLDFAFRSPDLYQVMYGLGGVPFSVAATREEGEKVAAPVARLVGEIRRENGMAADDIDIDRDVMVLWSTMHGLVSLAMAGRIAGGEHEAARLAAGAVRVYLAGWRHR